MYKFFTRFWLILLILVVLRLVITLLYLDYYTSMYHRVVFSADDCTRAATAKMFLITGNLFPNEQFLPFHLYLMAVGILVTGSIYTGAQLTNIILGIIFIVVVYLTVKKLFSKRIAFWSAIILCLEPFPLWMTISAGLADICLYLTLWVSLWLLLEAREKPGLLWLSAIAILLASATRYEGWAAAIVFILILWLGEFRKNQSKIKLTLLSLIAISFPLIWLGESLISFGDVMYRVRTITMGLEKDSASYLPQEIVAKILVPIEWFYKDNPIVAIVVIPSLAWLILKRCLGNNHLIFLSFPAAVFGFVIFSTISAGGGFMPDRYAAQIIPFVIPFVLASLDDIGQRLKAKGVHPAGALLVAGLIVLTIHSLKVNQTYSEGSGMSDDVIWAGARLKDIIESDAFEPGTLIHCEEGIGEFGLMMFSEHPEKLAPMDFTELSIEEILTTAKQEGASAWIVFSPNLADELESVTSHSRKFFTTRLGGKEPGALLLCYNARRKVVYDITEKNSNGRIINKSSATLSFADPINVTLTDPHTKKQLTENVNRLNLEEILSLKSLDYKNNITQLTVSAYAGIENAKLLKKINIYLSPPGTIFNIDNGNGWEERESNGDLEFLRNSSKAIISMSSTNWEGIATYFMLPPEPFQIELDINQRSHQGVYPATICTIEFWDLSFSLRPLLKLFYQISSNDFDAHEHAFLANAKHVIWAENGPGWRMIDITPKTLESTEYPSMKNWLDAGAVVYEVFGGAVHEHEILEISAGIINYIGTENR